jgi:hypothetical protein
MLAMGDMSAEMTRRNTEIFATEVIPHFRTEQARETPPVVLAQA